MANYNVWQYARWTYVIGRTMRFNYANTGERAEVEVFLRNILMGRSWLEQRMMNKSTSGKNYDFAKESLYNLAKMLMVVGRDLKKIPMTVTEKGYVDSLIASTGTRRYGNKGNLI